MFYENLLYIHLYGVSSLNPFMPHGEEINCLRMHLYDKHFIVSLAVLDFLSKQQAGTTRIEIKVTKTVKEIRVCVTGSPHVFLAFLLMSVIF